MSIQDFVYKDPGGKAAAVSGPIDKGYWVTANGKDPKTNQPTGLMQSAVTGDQIYFWLTSIEASFSMGGSFAQSQKTRSFYPRNLGAATITCQGIAPSSFYYQKLAEFIRATHVSSSAVGGLIRMMLPEGGIDVDGGQKGARQGYDMYGYVTKINRGAQKFDFYPTFQFDFIVTYSNDRQGLFTSSKANMIRLQNYTQIIMNEAKSTGGFVTNPNSGKGAGTGPPTTTPGPTVGVGWTVGGVTPQQVTGQGFTPGHF